MKDGVYWYVAKHDAKLEIYRLTVKGGRAQWSHQAEDFELVGEAWPLRHMAYTNYWNAYAESIRRRSSK